MALVSLLDQEHPNEPLQAEISRLLADRRRAATDAAALEYLGVLDCCADESSGRE